MKVFLYLLLSFSIFALAGPDSQKLGEQLADVTGAEKALEENFLATINTAMAQMKGGDPALFKAIREETHQFYVQHYKWSELRGLFGAAYAAVFSDEEMEAIIAFYQSPAGRKTAEKLGLASRLASQQVAEKLKDKTPLLQSSLIKLVQEHVDAKASKK